LKKRRTLEFWIASQSLRRYQHKAAPVKGAEISTLLRERKGDAQHEVNAIDSPRAHSPYSPSPSVESTVSLLSLYLSYFLATCDQLKCARRSTTRPQPSHIGS